MKNRISSREISAIFAPIQTALIAFKLGVAKTDAYHDMAAGLAVAYFSASRVERHRHLLPDLKSALEALTAIFERHDGKTDDEPFICDDDEFDRIDLAAQMYKALLSSTSWKYVSRAIQDARSMAY